MKKLNQISNQSEDLLENIYRNKQWLTKQHKNAKKKLTPKMYDMFQRFNQEMVMTAYSNSGRYKNLIQFISIFT